MRKLVVLLAAAGVLTTFVAAHTSGVQHEAPVLALNISTDRKTYAKGDNFPIHVRLTNVSKRYVFVGRDMWSNASPSEVTIEVVPQDGRPTEGWMTAADGFVPDASIEKLPGELLDWCLLLPPGYSYGSDTTADNLVERSYLIPGFYKLRATFESRGIGADTYFNPLLPHSDQMAALRDKDWNGQIISDELTIQIVDSPRKANAGQLKHK